MALMQHVPHTCAVYALNDPSVEMNASNGPPRFASLDDMVTCYEKVRGDGGSSSWGISVLIDCFSYLFQEIKRVAREDEPVNIVGFSFGGTIAALLTARLRNSSSAVVQAVLIDPTLEATGHFDLVLLAVTHTRTPTHTHTHTHTHTLQAWMLHRFVVLSHNVALSSESNEPAVTELSLRQLPSDDARWTAVRAALGDDAMHYAQKYVDNFAYHQQLLVAAGKVDVPDDVYVVGSQGLSGDVVIDVDHHALLQEPTVAQIASCVMQHFGMDAL